MKGPILSSLCYVRTATHTLMLHRITKSQDLHHGKWNGLGGKFLPGETPEECVVREVQEESGLSITGPTLHGFLTFPGFDGDHDWYVYVFTAHVFSGELVSSREGRCEWIEHDKVMSLPMWEGDAIFLKWLDQPRFFSAKFCYREGRLQHHTVSWY